MIGEIKIWIGESIGFSCNASVYNYVLYTSVSPEQISIQSSKNVVFNRRSDKFAFLLAYQLAASHNSSYQGTTTLMD